MNIAAFDLETNGIAGSSVLSASSIVFDGEGSILDIFNRFYLPHERHNRYAARIHGLTPERLSALRERTCTSPFFLEDWPNLIDFWEKWEVAGVVVHNLAFDTSFLPEIAQGALRWWCSMKGLTEYCAIPQRPGNFRAGARGFKWPRLGEASDIVCNGPQALSPSAKTVSIENALGCALPHVSLFDCFELYRMVSRLIVHRRELIHFTPFITPFRPPRPHMPTMPETGVKPLRDRFIMDILAYENSLRSVIQ